MVMHKICIFTSQEAFWWLFWPFWDFLNFDLELEAVTKTLTLWPWPWHFKVTISECCTNTSFHSKLSNKLVTTFISHFHPFQKWPWVIKWRLSAKCAYLCLQNRFWWIWPWTGCYYLDHDLLTLTVTFQGHNFRICLQIPVFIQNSLISL